MRDASTPLPAGGASHPADPGWRTWSVGERVVVRRRRVVPADAPPGEPRHTDVLGHLVAVDDAGVTLRTRDGELVRVPADVIAIGKRIPPPPAPRRRRVDAD